MSSQDLHQIVLRWPHTDANEVIVTGTFDQWTSSLRLARKPDGFEAPPVFIPWRHKIAYKFIVDGRWMTNDAEPTEIDHGFVNNVYTAPSKPVLPEPEPSTAPPSYHSESEVEHESVDKVDDKPTTNGTAVHVVRDTPTPTADPAPEQRSRVPDDEPEAAVEAVPETVAPAVEVAQAAVAQVAPAPIEVEKAVDEITSESEAPKEAPAPAASEPTQIPVPELAPNLPIGILPNSTLGGPSEDSPTVQVDSEHERSTHVPLRFATGTAAPAVVPQVEEAAPAPELVLQSEETTPALVSEEEAPEVTTPAPIEEEEAPEETTPAAAEETTPVLVEAEVEPPKEAALIPAEVEGTEASVVPVPEPAPAPPTEPEPVPVPAAVEEPESASPQESEKVAAPASQEPAVVPEPPSEPVPEAQAEVAAVQVPTPEPTAAAVSLAPAVEPTPVVEVSPAKLPATASEPTPQVAAVEAPALNGHSKTLSGASTSTAAPTLPVTPARKTSRKFSFPGHGKDKSGNNSPTGSSRFASREKREKRHSLLGKLKEIFTDKGKKEKSDGKA